MFLSLTFLLSLPACDTSGKDEGPWCEVTRTVVPLEQPAPNGIVPVDLLGWAELPVADTLRWSTGGDTPLHLQATHTAEAEWVDQEAVYPEGETAAIGIVCEDYLAIPASLAFSTDDGAFADTFSTELTVSEPDRARFSIDLVAAALAGTFDPTEWPEGEYDRLTMRAEGDLSGAGSVGLIHGSATRDLGCDPDGVCSAASEDVDVAAWGANPG